MPPLLANLQAALRRPPDQYGVRMRLTQAGEIVTWFLKNSESSPTVESANAWKHAHANLLDHGPGLSTPWKPTGHAAPQLPPAAPAPHPPVPQRPAARQLEPEPDQRQQQRSGPPQHWTGLGARAAEIFARVAQEQRERGRAEAGARQSQRGGGDGAEVPVNVEANPTGHAPLRAQLPPAAPAHLARARVGQTGGEDGAEVRDKVEAKTKPSARAPRKIRPKKVAPLPDHEALQGLNGSRPTLSMADVVLVALAHAHAEGSTTSELYDIIELIIPSFGKHPDWDWKKSVRRTLSRPQNVRRFHQSPGPVILTSRYCLKPGIREALRGEKIGAVDWVSANARQTYAATECLAVPSALAKIHDFHLEVLGLGGRV